MTGGGDTPLPGDEAGAPPTFDELLQAVGPDDADELPIDEVTLWGPDRGVDGEYWGFVLPGGQRSTVAWRDPEVARRKGAEVLRKQRQIQAMRGRS